MKTRQLGSSGPEISVIGMGAWEAGGMWGANPPDEQITRAYDAGFDAGVNWIDTAEVYGPHRSEELVGQALRGRAGVLVSTKLAPSPFGSGYDPDGIRADAEASLRRLEREVIDLYFLHTWVPGIDIGATWGAMAQLVDDGLVRAGLLLFVLSGVFAAGQAFVGAGMVRAADDYVGGGLAGIGSGSEDVLELIRVLAVLHFGYFLTAFAALGIGAAAFAFGLAWSTGVAPRGLGWLGLLAGGLLVLTPLAVTVDVLFFPSSSGRS